MEVRGASPRLVTRRSPPVVDGLSVRLVGDLWAARDRRRSPLHGSRARTPLKRRDAPANGGQRLACRCLYSS